MGLTSWFFFCLLINFNKMYICMIRSMRCNNNINVCTMKYELYVEYSTLLSYICNRDVSFLRKLCSWLHVRMICMYIHSYVLL